MKDIYLKNNKRHHRKVLKEKPFKLKITGINQFFTDIITTHVYRPHRYKQHKHQSQSVGRNIHYHNMKNDAPRPKLRRQDKNDKINRDQSRYRNYRKSNDDVKLDTATKGSTIKQNHLNVAANIVTNVDDTFEDISADRHVYTNEYEYVTLDYWKGTDAVDSAKPTENDIGTKIKPLPSNSIKTTIIIRNKLKSNGTTSLQKRYTDMITDNIHQSIIPTNDSTKRNNNQGMTNDNNTSNNVISATYISEVTIIPNIKEEQTIPYTTDILNDKQIDFRASNNTVTPNENITKSPILAVKKTEMKPATLIHDAFGSIERDYIKN
ncbi:hypothetical protein K1T71_014731 [Dendrolimus kikuchii]|nr:hypothetical protein K1T71_014731 [Dendrolimus kikuchii]